VDHDLTPFDNKIKLKNSYRWVQIQMGTEKYGWGMQEAAPPSFIIPISGF
jgi:hypothetical protein